jgi:cyclic pyranopterin phosphate synthase
MTTNGLLLEDKAAFLGQAGLSRINVSLDSLCKDRFFWITNPVQQNGCGNPETILRGLEAARKAGMNPVKINVVLIRDFNDDELDQFAALTLNNDYEVRFIEFMPFGPDGFWGYEKVISAAEIIARLEVLHGPLIPLGRGKGSGPAVRYRIPGYSGTIGFITPISEHFCVCCNRIRITANGKLRTCLFSDNETDLLIPLRTGSSSQVILSLIESALDDKPDGHGFTNGGTFRACARTMSHIGG